VAIFEADFFAGEPKVGDVGAEVEVKLGEVGLHDAHAGVGKVGDVTVIVGDAAKLVGKKVKVRVNAVTDGVAWAELATPTEGRRRVTEASQYIRNVGLDEAAGATQLNRVVRNAFQEEINRHTVRELLSAKRELIMSAVQRFSTCHRTSVSGSNRASDASSCSGHAVMVNPGIAASRAARSGPALL